MNRIKLIITALFLTVLTACGGGDKETTPPVEDKDKVKNIIETTTKTVEGTVDREDKKIEGVTDETGEKVERIMEEAKAKVETK